MTVKTLYILRGISGSGKSTLAKRLTFSYEKEICSNDKYFYAKYGEYKWSKEDMPRAIDFCWHYFKLLISSNTPNIVLDNTNTKREHFQHYIEYAKEHDYYIVEIVLPKTPDEVEGKNIHGVDRETLERQYKNLMNSLK